MQPSEFWALSPWEFWLEFDQRVELHRRVQTTTVGGKPVPMSALQEAQSKARKLHKAKQEAKQEA